jgi:DNA-directed RNA polymerase specialized sigma24 family protein
MARDDAALWSRIQSGDAEAFGLLFERYGQAIYAYCFRRTADADRAADLMSVTFLEAWRRRKVALHGDKVLPWLFGVATNVLRNERRAVAATRRRSIACPLPSTSKTSPRRRQTG